MDKRGIQYALIALAILVALVGSYYGITLPAPEIPPAGEAEFGSQAVRERISIEASEDVILKGGADLNVYSDAAKATRVLQIDGAGTGLTLSDGNLVIADFARYTPQTAIAVTDNSIITATGTYQQLTAAGNTATASVVCGTAGNIVTLVNTTTNTIVLTDTGTLMLTGNLTLGQYDTATLLSDGTNCIQLGTTNN